MKVVYIIGIGMGNLDTLTLEAKRYIENAEIIIGAQRILEGFQNKEKQVFSSYNPKEITEYIDNFNGSKVAVLMSGDTGFFSGTKRLLPLLKKYEVKIIPGISSLSYFAGKLGISWEDCKIVSLHGRNENIIPTVKANPKVFAVTDGNIDFICKQLCQGNLGNVEVYVGENLSYENEKIVKGKAFELLDKDFSPLSVVLIENKNVTTYHSIGIKDEEFIRGNVPMTKSEVRAISISKLNIKQGDILYDIGAGTGSVSIEMALAAPKTVVYAIECNEDAIELIRSNKEHFGVHNLEIIKGTAPKALENLPIPSGAFIGGSKGNIKEIIVSLLKRNKDIRLVVNAITLETLTETVKVFETCDIGEIEILQVGISKAKSIGTYHMMAAQNPIFVISGKGKRRKEIYL